MKAIEYRKSVPRYVATRALAARWPRAVTGGAGLVRLVDAPVRPLPTPRWVGVRPRLSGICGSDLATVTASGSAYFSPLLSYPFVLGHETVGEVTRAGAAVDDLLVGARVVLEPALSCAVRGIAPPCGACAAGDDALCANVTRGDLSAGIQTGFCRDTGGAWSEEFVAHRRQLHRAPDDLPDEALVLAEPFACALHAALRVPPPSDGGTAVVIGCGTIGLLVVAALRALGSAARVVAVARHAHQEALARALGASAVARERGAALRARIAEETGAEILRPEIGGPVFVGGAEVVYDCVGSAATLDDAVRFARPGGRVAVVGMPALPSGIDWTAIWYKELSVRGCYAYGVETVGGERVRTFALALSLLRTWAPRLAPLVGARYRLAAYREAIASALDTGRSGVVKTVFDMTDRPAERRPRGGNA